MTRSNWTSSATLTVASSASRHLPFGHARFAGNLLYDVQPGDPATYVALALAIVAIAALASWIPARRAQRVDPVGVLRNN
jgi:ABC-type lipoprotein release transport system permease subunit